jgi:hypothetical protein
VPQYVTADRSRWIAEKGVRLCLNLIGDKYDGIIQRSKTHKVVQVLVQLLLPVCKRTPTNILSSKMGS